MRSVPSLLLGGLVCTIAFASCGSPEPSPGSDAGPPIDGVQACIDAHALEEAKCGVYFSDEEKWCQDEFKNAGPMCRDLFSAEWACNLAALQAIPDGGTCPGPWPCQSTHDYQTSACVEKYGCRMPLWECRDGYVGPDGCACRKWCFDPPVTYSTNCKPNGATWTCDCYIDDGPGSTFPPVNVVGTCDQPGPVCDVNVDLSCCNQFFMLSF